MSGIVVLCTNRWQSWHKNTHSVWTFSFAFMTWINTFYVKGYHFFVQNTSSFSVKIIWLMVNETYLTIEQVFADCLPNLQVSALCGKELKVVWRFIILLPSSWIFPQHNQLAVCLNMFSVHSVFIKSCCAKANSSFCTVLSSNYL